MSDTTVRFGLLCSMFQAMGRDRSAAKKRQRFRTLLDRVYTSRDYFSAVRLILPSLDRERGSYGLKETALAAALVDALAISKDSDDALRLINWRKGGKRTGANAGNFALVAFDILQRRQGLASGGLTIKDVNDALDQLSLREGRGEKAAVMSDLIKKTNAVEMKWILMIILKDLKLGISEKSIFHEFHPDAEDLFNVSCDLKLVCEKLKDRGQRHKRQDIEVGRAVRPQLAMRISNAAAAWKKFHGKQVVAECKFDGDRIQIHKSGKEIHFFSRNFLDHSEYLHGMSDLILHNILVDRCILDGEMLVWDTSSNRFAEFGSNQEIAKAAMQGLQGDRQLCYVAFDILYAGDTSVIHQSLAERQELLHKVVKPLKGRLEILAPNNGLNDNLQIGEPCWSIVTNCVEDVEKFFKETIEKRDEGIVLKDLGSKWEPGDRSGKWLKLKPDYINAGTDLDVLIIGGYFGSGRHGGEVAQFLVGLAERSDSDFFPKRFLSFCRVGSGLSDEDLDLLITRLKPYFRKNEYPKRIPHCYEVTNNLKERPDVWVESPDKSVILSITSDIRTIKSEVFAAPYSLRFPRIQRVRYDKPWHESLDVESFRDLVQSSDGNTRRGADEGALQKLDVKPKRSASKGEKRNISVISANSGLVDTAAVKEKTMLFANMMFYIVNVPPSYSVDYFHKLVAENGGSFSMNLNDSVTHCIAAEKKGIKYQAAMHHGDIIHYSWVLECCNIKKLVNIKSKHFLFFADISKRKNRVEIDAFSDYYFWDIDIEDLKQIFSNMAGSGNTKMIEHYRTKYVPVKRMGLFCNCSFYLHEMPARKNDLRVISEIAMRRMELEITMHGGKICNDLQLATHLIVYAVLGSHEFNEIYSSFPATERHLLRRKELYVLGHNWFEDSLDKNAKLPEMNYSLKPDSLEELKVEVKDNLTFPSTTCTINEQNSATTGKRKRGRQAAAKLVLRRNPRTRSKIATGSVKLGAVEPESEESSDTAPSTDAARLSKDENAAIKAQRSASQVNDPGGVNPESPKQEQVSIEMDAKAGAKLEMMVDPIQAMLLDMIPTLSQNPKMQVDSGEPSSTPADKRPLQEPKPNPNPSPNPGKKKVSYKGVADELLKDW